MRALVRSMHQLANGRAGCCHHAGRQAGSEHIGAADQPHDFEFGMVGDAEAADRAHAFGKGADNEIDIVDHARLFHHAATVLADEAHGMRFVDQHHGAVFLGDGDHFLQRSDIAQHRIDAFQHHQLAGAFGNALQALFHRFDIIVLERHDFGIAQSAAVPDAGMAVDVEDDVIAFAGNGRNNPEIGLVAGRKDHGMVHGIEVHERLLDFLVALICAVQHAATGGPRSEIGQCLPACLDHVGIEGHAHVIVGAEQDRVAPVADRTGRRQDLLHHQVERIFLAARQQSFAQGDDVIEFGEQILAFSFDVLRLVRLDDAFAHQSACSLVTASTN